MNLNEEVQMSYTEKFIMGKELNTIQQAVNRSKTLIRRRVMFNFSGKHYMESLSEFGQTVGNYRWFPGGFWQPANCKARWKVNKMDCMRLLNAELLKRRNVIVVF